MPTQSSCPQLAIEVLIVTAYQRPVLFSGHMGPYYQFWPLGWD